MLPVANARVPCRPATPGRETSLVLQFLAAGSLADRRTEQPVVFTEPKLATGFPDIVAVYLSNKPITVTPGRTILHDEHLRLLHHLCSVKSTSFDEIESGLGWRGKMLERCIAELADADLVCVRGSKIVARHVGTIFAVRKIVAIEAKIDNWKRALRQACSNTWFASHSYVLIPKTRAIDHVEAAAKAIGVGVMVFDGDKTKTVVNPVVRSIPVSYGSWLFNEWSLRLIFDISAK
jgi:hypothetical protein